MLKDFTKYLPFLQTPGKRTKPRDESAQGPGPDVPLPEQEDGFLDEWETGLQSEDAVQEEIPAPSEDQEETPSQPVEAPTPHSREDDLEQGLAACRDKLYPEALKAFRRAADAGSAEAQFLCGQMYQRGLAVEVDCKRALAWYKISAKQGFVHAQMACGALYEEGSGTEMDLKRALFWYEQAAKQGAVEAQLKCGAMYSCGRAETRNPKKARRWLESAAAGGNEEAQRILRERF